MIAYFGHLQGRISASTELLEACDWDETEVNQLLEVVKEILDEIAKRIFLR